VNEPTKGHIESDGLKIAYLDWGGSGDPLLMLHPNGFCAGFFAPLAARLTNTHRTIAVDLRGHGESDTPTNLADLHFAPMAADVGRVLEHLGVSEVALLGVSLGGGVGVHVADLLGPRMGALMLCEAIAFEFQQAPSENSNFMAALARKRRAVWPSREAMAESYGSRPPFGALEPAFLDAYVQWGTRIRPDNTIELACDPETEAQVFEIGATAESTGRAFELLAEVPCPVSVLAGADTDLGIHRFEAQAAQAGVELRILDGGHFFLQEDTDRAEALVRELLPS
jgi:pimeloyl-ACP methyl ester carboxylesterase